MLKKSRQREAIRLLLAGRTDHPTAETIYTDIKQEYPNISLGTIYRNLSLLTELGEIQKLSSATGKDRYDGNAKQHYHFYCNCCERVMDIMIAPDFSLEKQAQAHFRGQITGHSLNFYGLCPDCLKNETNE